MFICSDVFFSEPTYNSKTAAEPLTIFVVHAHSEWPYVFLTPCRFWLQQLQLVSSYIDNTAMYYYYYAVELNCGMLAERL